MSISEFIDKAQTQLPKDTLREVPGSYLEEPRSILKGSKNSILALPQSTKEVSTIVNFCRATGVGIIPYSGGTGLVGGQVNPTDDPVVILSTSKMNKIRKIYPDERVVIVDSGVILDDLQKAVEEDDLFFPLSLASQGSCRIGGNLATNAGGVQVLKYGNIRDLCLGIEAVLPNGEVFNGLKRLRKDNTGYDIKNLLIGSEGTLGVITGASLRLFPKPNHVATAILSVRSPSIALELLNNAQEFLDERVSSFELIGQKAIEFIKKVLPSIKVPIKSSLSWFVLIEITSSQDQKIKDTFEEFIQLALAKNLVEDGIIAQSEEQRKTFWSFRESIPEANRLVGSIVSADISLPLSEVAGFIETVSEKISSISDCQINCFGHVGDGNLHYNLFRNWNKPISNYENSAPDLSRLVYDEVVSRNGSISAEHGIGRLKKEQFLQTADRVKVETMKAIKNAMDPSGLFNPGVLLD